MPVQRMAAQDLRWRVDPGWLVEQRGAGADHGRITAQLTNALQLALHSVGHRTGHVFVRGNPACDRAAILDEALAQVQPPPGPGNDLAFVHNFERPDQPRLLVLAAGQGERLRAALAELALFVRDGLSAALESRPIVNRLTALHERAEAEIRRMTAELEQQLKPHGLVLVREQVGHMLQLTVNVQQTGRVVTQDDLANLVSRGQVTQQEFERMREVIRQIRPELLKLARAVNRAWGQARKLRERMLQAECRRLMAELAEPLIQRIDHPGLKQHIEAVIRDVLDKRVDKPTAHLADPELLYGANIIHRAADRALAVIHERMPGPRNLAGIIDPAWVRGQRAVASFHGIRTGTLVSAGTGFVVLDAEDLVGRPETLQLLGNAMAHGVVHVQAASSSTPAVSLKPDPVPVQTRLIVTGTRRHWRQLGREHPAFLEYFGTPVDIPETFPRTPENVSRLAAELRQAAQELIPDRISDEALAALIEHAARIAGPGRLSRRMAELRRLLRQAALLARAAADDHVGAGHVHRAIESARPGHPDAAIPIGDHTWFPARRLRVGRLWISAAHSDGNREHGQIVQVQAGLARSAGTRIILSGLDNAVGPDVSLRVETLLAQLLHWDQPLDLHAVIEFRTARQETALVFDDSMIPGALLALLSRLADVPLRQDLAVLAALDSDGGLTRVAALNEQIEDAWRVARMEDAGTSGIIIPSPQRDSLMLCPDLLQSVSNQLFELFTAANIQQIIELLTGSPPGDWRGTGFEGNGLLERARRRLSRSNRTEAAASKPS
ncbi:MAG: AAA family ATPase [Wenzhouxiangellaceae bacterium]|nr:AAA family ATPase [Wenzhouxiangellaceae bacterium]